MNFTKLSGAAALTILLGGAAYADGGEPATAAGCTHMQKKVSDALDANTQSPHYAQAHDMAVKAHDYCAQGLFRYGVERYAKVLEALGAA